MLADVSQCISTVYLNFDRLNVELDRLVWLDLGASPAAERPKKGIVKPIVVAVEQRKERHEVTVEGELTERIDDRLDLVLRPRPLRHVQPVDAVEECQRTSQQNVKHDEDDEEPIHQRVLGHLTNEDAVANRRRLIRGFRRRW